MMEMDIEAKYITRLFAMAEEVAHVGYWEWDIRTNEVVWSSRKIEIYGEDAESFVPSFEKFIEVVDEETKGRVLKEIDDVLSGSKEYYDLQHKISLKNGKTAWVHEKGFLIYEEQTPVKMVGIVYDITDKMIILEELKNVEAQSNYLQSHDRLTSLFNKESLLKDIDEHVERQKPFSLIFLDIDNFRTVNNTFGHLFGDIVIRKFAEILKEEVQCGRVYRYGGDEFVILADHMDVPVEEFVEGLETLLEKNVSILGNSILLTASMGICSYPDCAVNTKDIVKNANSALTIAKESGSHKIMYYENYMSDYIAKKRSILDALGDAIKEEVFIVHFQPKVDVMTEEIIGFEALVRWKNEDNQLMPPSLFLPIAQDYGFMGKIDHIVLKKALKQLSKWHKEGFVVTLSVNFNMSDFGDGRILGLLEAEKELLKYVTVEITESELMACSQKELEIIDSLKGLGLKVSLDDFGTGYSSLKYIHKLPIDELKIDKGFVENIPGSEKDEKLVKIIKSIVDTFGLDCVVEGVERKDQKEFFQNLGLTTIQGYFYGKPMDAAAATRMLEKKSR